MKYLFDTQTLIWAEFEPVKIKGECRDILLNPDIIKCISLLSIWEISIKQTIDKLSYQFNWTEYIKGQKLDLIGISFDHILMTKRLPLIHRDPFDRLLIAQSIVERMPLLTADKEIQKYHFSFVKV